MDRVLNTTSTKTASKKLENGVLVVDAHQAGCVHLKDCAVAVGEEGTKAEDGRLVEDVVVETERRGANLIIRWFKRVISDPVLVILRMGMEPRKLAFSAALGVSLGIFPICGVTVGLCAVAIALLRSNCHPPTLLLTNFIVTPLELSLVIPFMRLGEWILNGEPLVLGKDAFWKAITGHASKELLFAIIHALTGWLVAFPFMVGALYICLLPLIRYGIKKFGAELEGIHLIQPSEELEPLLQSE